MQKFLRFRLPKEQLQLVVGDLGASKGIAALDFLKAQDGENRSPLIPKCSLGVWGCVGLRVGLHFRGHKIPEILRGLGGVEYLVIP